MNDVASIRQISPNDFLALGVDDMAYIRPTVRDGQNLFIVCAADGQEIVGLPRRELAEALIRQHDLEPVTLQ